mgnify:CR=1 FL=1
MSDAGEIYERAQERAAAQQAALPRVQQRELGGRVKAAELAGDDQTAQILARIYRRVLAGTRQSAGAQPAAENNGRTDE